MPPPRRESWPGDVGWVRSEHFRGGVGEPDRVDGCVDGAGSGSGDDVDGVLL
jgi:hypothetical protein